jgi:hypothetical protein
MTTARVPLQHPCSTPFGYTSPSTHPVPPFGIYPSVHLQYSRTAPSIIPSQPLSTPLVPCHCSRLEVVLNAQRLLFHQLGPGRQCSKLGCVEGRSELCLLRETDRRFCRYKETPGVHLDPRARQRDASAGTRRHQGFTLTPVRDRETRPRVPGGTRLSP